MPDLLEQFGERVTSWTGQSMGNHQTAFFIYDRDGSYTGIGLVVGNYYSQSYWRVQGRPRAKTEGDVALELGDPREGFGRPKATDSVKPIDVVNRSAPLLRQMTETLNYAGKWGLSGWQ